MQKKRYIEEETVKQKESELEDLENYQPTHTAKKKRERLCLKRTLRGWLNNKLMMRL